MSNISKIKIGDSTYSLSTTCSVTFSYSSSTPTMWNATASGVSLEDGLHITGKAPVAAALAKVQLNGGDAHYVVDYKGEVPTATITKNSVVMLRYNGSISHGGVSGVWQIDSNYYNTPLATSTTVGGVKPVEKTDTMTQQVGVDSNGALFAEPSNPITYASELPTAAEDSPGFVFVVGE